MRSIGRKNLAVEILRALATGVAICFIFGSPNGSRQLLRGLKKEWQLRKTRLTLDRLQRKGLVAYRMKGKRRIEVEITDGGKKKVLEYQMDLIDIKKPARWDGRWRIIFSDISENHKKARDALRQKFYAWGFYPLQKSVFVYPYPCSDAIVVMRDLFYIPTKSLLMVETDHIGNEAELKKFFRLH